MAIFRAVYKYNYEFKCLHIEFFAFLSFWGVGRSNWSLRELFRSSRLQAGFKIQLFRETICTEVYATMPKGIVGSGCLLLLDQILQCFIEFNNLSARRKEKAIKAWSCELMLIPSAHRKHKKLRSSNVKRPLPINSFGIAASSCTLL